jgi:bisanhydrobacterioruberin hydratase
MQLTALAEDNRLAISRFLLLSSYAAAMLIVVGLQYRDFLLLTPFNLLMCCALVIWNHHRRDRLFWRFAAVAYLTGYWIEVAGVNTGIIFGSYGYGHVLGWKVWGAPLLIGVNWFTVIYICNDAVYRGLTVLPKSLPPLLAVSLCAIVPTAFDVLVEPVAIRYHMWNWAGDGVPPLQNYIAWYAVSWALSFAYHQWVGPTNRNPVSLLLLALQVLFFLML